MKKLFYLIAFGVLVALASCSSTNIDEPSNTRKTLPRAIVPTYSDQAISRAATNLQESTFATGANVGFFVNDASDAQLYANISHAADGSGNFTSDQTMMWPYTGNINVYAYAPYSSSASLTAANSHQVATDQTTDDAYIASDLLIGAPATNPVANTAYATGGSQKVDVKFKHKLTKVTLNFTAQNATSYVTNAKVFIHNVAIGCTYDIKAGTVTTGSTTSDILVSQSATVDATTTTYSCSAIIVPQTVAAGSEFASVQIGNKKYSFTLSSAQTFASGAHHTYNITLSQGQGQGQGQGQVAQNISGTIDAWTDGGSASGNAQCETSIKLGDYFCADGTYVSSTELIPANVVGVVFSLTDVPEGYKAYVFDVHPAQQTSYKFYNGSSVNIPSTYTISSINDIKNATSGLTVLQNIKTSLSNYLCFNNLFGNNYYPSEAYPNATEYFIPSIAEFMKLIEFFTPENATFTTETSTNTSTYNGSYVIPDSYKFLHTYNYETRFPEAKQYWTCTMFSTTQVWSVNLAKQAGSSTIKVSPLSKDNSAYAVPIMLTK